MSAPEPYYADDLVTLHLGDCLDVLAGLADDGVDSVVTDPPYGLEFMGREWDAPWRSGINADAGFSTPGFTDGSDRLPRPTFTGSTNPTCRNCGGKQRGRRDGTAIWKTCACESPKFPNVRAAEMRAFQDWCEVWAGECLRVLKPGAYLLAFGGTRTWHRLACAIEDAGFEIRDSVVDLTGQDAPGLMWIHGQGFPKSADAGRAVDMEVCQLPGRHCMRQVPKDPKPDDHVCPESEEGEPWREFGTALKPAWEPIVVGRKPSAGTLAQNLLARDAGALNVGACRVGADPRVNNAGGASSLQRVSRVEQGYRPSVTESRNEDSEVAGRWPPNVLLSEEATAELDRQGGALTSGAPAVRRRSGSDASGNTSAAYGAESRPTGSQMVGYGDTGGASRFFPVFRYEAKAPVSERPRLADGTAHPTVKPLDLMRWLVRLVTPPGGTVGDFFAGSGTTAEACVIEGFRCILAEKDPAHAELIKTRLSKPIQPDLFGGAA